MELSKTPTIIPIFPTPIYLANLNRNFLANELSFVDKNKNEVVRNEGNKSSKDTYILNNSIFNNLKDEISTHINKYFKDVINPIHESSLYITQSWLNYTEENQFHHEHSHPNSIVSGVLYINAVRESDEIVFSKEINTTIQIKSENYNNFNSTSMHFMVGTGDLILFPSNLKHYVRAKKGNDTRISISFNTFVRGKIGSNHVLTELML
jgi:uncharacterized protein (TIGR02466 family)